MGPRVKTAPVTGLGKNPNTATMILSSLAGGEKHGYALVKDVEEFSGVHLPPGTLYEALARLESLGFIEALEVDDRRRPYRLTATGAAALSQHLTAQQKVVSTGLRRLHAGWTFSAAGAS
jgi:DNA-binding PadR family transcriptional regulator